MAARSLTSVRVFERLGIDYCCGGKIPLADACRRKGLDVYQVQRELDAAASEPETVAHNWASAALQDLIEHIVSTHHEYLRREFQPLEDRLDKVYRVYNQRYGPALVNLPEVYRGLRAELESHMQKEERILFPAIIATEAAVRESRPIPFTPFGSLSNPVRMMEHEHDDAGRALSNIRAITHDFEVPDYACVTFRALMAGLEAFEKDLHLHIHLENNILFPRALRL